MTDRNIKTLIDIKQDMSLLYEEVRSGRTDLKTASELANISGKFLKAAQIELATNLFLNKYPTTTVRGITHGVHPKKSDGPAPGGNSSS